MPNQINEDELQKAIDDITNSAQNEADTGEMPAEAPAALGADGVAAGVAAPENINPEAAPMPDFGVPPMPPVPPAPGAFDPSTVAPLGGVAPASAPVVPAAPEAAPAPAPAAPAEEAPMIAPPEGTPEAVPAPEPTAMGEMPAEAPGVGAPAEVPEVPGAEDIPEMAIPAAAPELDAGSEQIKAEILRDLSPLMDKVEIEPEKKFGIYRDMMTTNHDKSVIPSAYETAKLISDEQKRGEALVSLIDALDN